MPGFSKTKTYKVWQQMKHRCNNPANKRYQRYGGRGIGYCRSWEDFSLFLADMGEAPHGCSLDRTDNDADYNKENCRWVSMKEQVKNRRGRRVDKNSILQKSIEHNISRWKVYYLLKKGLKLEQILI